MQAEVARSSAGPEAGPCFVHLHLHSQYSLLEGAIRIDALMPRLRELGMDAVALTDHGNMFGAVHFYKAAKKHGIKPIFGSGVYVAQRSRFEAASRESGHLTLLAQTQEGYQDLAYLVSMGFVQGFSGRPRIDFALLAERGAGLVGLSGSIDGIVGQALLLHGMAAAREAAKACAAALPEGHFYLELNDSDTADQARVNEAMHALGHELGLPLVVTGNAHYLSPDDAPAHEILTCISQQRSLGESRQRSEHANTLYVRSAAEMWRRFGHECPEGLRNTVRIAQSCNVELDLSQTFLPHYEVPDGFTRETYLADIAQAGLRRRIDEAYYPIDEAAYRDRLTYELSVITKMGFAGYFLVVWDFIRHAKERGIPVGPGRGSGAGSLVAYSLGITDLDPIPYDLLFERFLNPERVSMPDFDIDFCQDRRGEVIDYVAQKYGRNNVGQIVTYSLLSAKSVIKDVGRVMGLPFAEVNELTKLIPSLVNGKKVDIAQALQIEPRLRQVQQEKPVYGEVIDIARKLEGLGRQTGMHAAGIVIGDKPLWEYVPVCRGKDGELVTQFAKDEVEEAGLVKFDFLGLKTLTVIAKAQALVRQRQGDGPRGPHASFDAERVPLNDKKVYHLIAKGDTDGVFQLESSGFKELLKRLRPDRFEDVVAAVALYRPGPLDAGMVDDYIARKHGRKKVTYPHPVCAQILQTTYGVIVYQEQVMRIAVALCGFSMGEADVLRKAMGKKKADVMAQMREKFVQGAVQKSQMVEREAEELFGQIEKFAGYAFNKSHSAAYAVISYQTAYLKTFFPVEFMAALLSCEMRDQDTVVRYISSAREHGLSVRPPCVNRSLRDFSVEDDLEAKGGRAILFGLGAVKGLGDGAIEAVAEGRSEAPKAPFAATAVPAAASTQGAASASLLAAKATRPFVDLFDFCERVDLRRLHKRTLEALVKSGAMDAFGPSRAHLHDSLERAVEHGQRFARDRQVGQTSLFALVGAAPGGMGGGHAVGGASEITPEWPEKERLAAEKEALGFYITGHPLDAYDGVLGRVTTATTAELRSQASQGGGRGRAREEVRVAGVVSAIRERPLKSGTGRMAFVTLEDRLGSIEVIVFSKSFADGQAALYSGEPLLVAGAPMVEGDDDAGRVAVKLRASQVTRLSDAREQVTRGLTLRLDGALANDANAWAALKAALLQHPGSVPVKVELPCEGTFRALLKLGEAYRVSASEPFVQALHALPFVRHVQFATQAPPASRPRPTAPAHGPARSPSASVAAVAPVAASA